MVAMTTLYGPTEMIDGGFLWVKRCWVLAMARGHYYEEYHGSSQFVSNGYFVLGGKYGSKPEKEKGGNLHILTRGQFLEIAISPLKQRSNVSKRREYPSKLVVLRK